MLKRSRWLLLKRPEKLTGEQRGRLAELVRRNLRTVRAYLLKEDFQSLWGYVSPYWAGQFLDRWCTRTMRSRLDPMKEVARMVALALRPDSELVPSPGAVLQWRCRRLQRKGQSDHQTGVWVPHLRGTGSRFESRTWRPARTKTHPQILLTRPKTFPPALPYIYSREELRRLLDATKTYRKRVNQLEPHTFRTLLLVLYGAGLRRGEALHLTLADVDLQAAVLTVRETKFDKTRFVPLGPQLAQAMEEYATQRRASDASQTGEAPFFVNRDGTPLAARTVSKAFLHLRRAAGVSREPEARYQPRLHDLRHAFAVHRLTAWYREGADVQRLLPLLSTYLGHVSVAATQVYLSMTPELLEEAALRFERYTESGNGGDHG